MFLLLLLDDINAAVCYLTHTATLAGGARMLSGKIHTKKSVIHALFGSVPKMEAECSLRVFNFPEKCRKCCVDLFLSVVSFEQLANLFSIFWEEE